MRIVACIKQVPDTTQVQIDPVTNTLVREGIPFIVNPYDTHAIEEGLRLKDRFGLTVTAISMGPPNAEATLRKALSLGVDQAILLSDRVFGGADTLATSKVLATAVPGLYFCGVHFLRTRRSSLLWGVGDDARVVAKAITRPFGVPAHISTTNSRRRLPP